MQINLSQLGSCSCSFLDRMSIRLTASSVHSAFTARSQRQEVAGEIKAASITFFCHRISESDDGETSVDLLDEDNAR